MTPDSRLSSLPQPHLSPDLSDIFNKERKLTKGNTDQQYGQWPKDGYQEYINDSPKPVLGNREYIHDLFGNIAGHTAANGEGADDKGQLKTAYFPFLLKAIKHNELAGRKSAEKTSRKNQYVIIR